MPEGWRRRAGSLSGLPDVSDANEFPGSQVGSQRRQAPGHVRPHRARIAAGERLACRRLAPSGDGSGLYGMQKVRGSNPLSSTWRSSRFSRARVHVWTWAAAQLSRARTRAGVPGVSAETSRNCVRGLRRVGWPRLTCRWTRNLAVFAQVRAKREDLTWRSSRFSRARVHVWTWAAAQLSRARTRAGVPGVSAETSRNCVRGLRRVGWPRLTCRWTRNLAVFAQVRAKREDLTVRSSRFSRARVHVWTWAAAQLSRARTRAGVPGVSAETSRNCVRGLRRVGWPRLTCRWTRNLAVFAQVRAKREDLTWRSSRFSRARVHVCCVSAGPVFTFGLGPPRSCRGLGPGQAYLAFPRRRPAIAYGVSGVWAGRA